MDCGLPGSSVCGIFQARVLEWFAISFSIDLGADAIRAQPEGQRGRGGRRRPVYQGIRLPQPRHHRQGRGYRGRPHAGACRGEEQPRGPLPQPHSVPLLGQAGVKAPGTPEPSDTCCLEAGRGFEMTDKPPRWPGVTGDTESHFGRPSDMQLFFFHCFIVWLHQVLVVV